MIPSELLKDDKIKKPKNKESSTDSDESKEEDKEESRDQFNAENKKTRKVVTDFFVHRRSKSSVVDFNSKTSGLKAMKK